MAADLASRTMQRASWRIIPLIMVLYFVSYLDRVNIGFAALTMNKELGITDEAFGLASGIFFWGYFLFEVPSNIVLEKVGARIWIARVMITWGIISGAFAYVSGPASYYVLRFLLGVAEAGFFPGIVLYLSYWFPAHRRAAVTSLFMAAAPISTAIGSPVSAALLQMDNLAGLKGWQWMFVLEALPAVLLGVFVFFFMTDRPQQAQWLKDDERRWLVETMDAEIASRKAHGHASLWRGLADLRVLILAVIYLGTSAGLYTLGLWAPLLMKSFGLSTTDIGWLNAIPSIIAVVAMYLWSWNSDRTGERTWHVVIAVLVAAGGLAFAAVAQSVAGVVLALTLVNIGISASKPPLWSMPTLFLSGTAAAAGIATINSIGNLGGFVGPYAIGWLKQTTGGYAAGLLVVAALLVLSAVLTLVLARGQKAS
ncbi:MFS transporter [Methylovirgula sp. 4M-Z18]|uniref:MFS transporter n=1 Tax=Methylovirgula sp. 4M-Z18 TaxID=2293567 RepID=UPI000E2FE94A|nr:MFS transporter [Methylovirgula sp. 4M-Z18]RFB79752.1 MFS transporter [Methylovirgula sp. 4M-Z18]